MNEKLLLLVQLNDKILTFLLISEWGLSANWSLWVVDANSMLSFKTVFFSLMHAGSRWKGSLGKEKWKYSYFTSDILLFMKINTSTGKTVCRSITNLKSKFSDAFI